MRTGTLLGVPYQVQPVWLLVFAIAIVTFMSSVGGGVAETLPTAGVLLVGGLVVALFVACIVAHELSHALMRRRLGLAVRPVQLLTLGRPVEAEPDPTSPKDELLVAATGPVLSAAIAAALLGLASLFEGGSSKLVEGLYWLCWWLAFANLVLAGFHLVPVLPLDGGRIVQAAIWAVVRDLDRATDISALVGRGFGYIVIGSGLFVIFSVDLFFGIWMVLLGWFATRLSRSAVDRRRMQQLTAGLSVKDATITDITEIPAGMTVEALMEQDRQRGGHGVYPVVEDGRTLGIFFTSRVHGPLRRSRPDQLVSEAAIPLERAPTYGPDEPLIHAVERLETLRTDSLPVVDPDEPSRLYGIVTREKALERLRMRHRLAQARGGSASLGERG